MTMQSILDKMHGTVTEPTPITYSSREKSAAKTVLDRLLAKAPNRSLVQRVVKVSEEV